MQNLKVAVIGVGNMGKFHARTYKSIPEVDLVAVSDLQEEVGKKIATENNCHYFSDYKELIANEQPDLVTVAVPTRFHKEVAQYCLEHGVHTLVEKPIADTIENAKYLLGVAKQYKLIFTIGHIERYNPAVVKMKEIIDSGRLGEIHSIIIRRVGISPPQIKDANVIIDLAVHDIDILNYLLGGFPNEVLVHGGKAIIQNRHDYADIFLKFGNTSALIQANWITPVKIRKMNITGSKGYAELDYVTQDVTLFESNYSTQSDSFGDFVIKFGLPNKVEVGVEKQEPLKRELLEFISAVKEGMPTTSLVTPEQAIAALEIALTADTLLATK